MVQILIAHADGDEAVAAEIAKPLENAGYEVVHHGSLFVGDSLMQKASQAIAQGSPVVLCGTVRAIGTGWANFLVNAARRHQEARIFALQMEENAYLDFLTLDGRIARYWQDPARAVADLLAALSEYYPTRKPAGAEQRLDQLEQRYRELALETCDIVDLANFPIGDRELITRDLLLRSLYVSLRVTVDIPPGMESHDLDRKLQDLEARRKEQDEDPEEDQEEAGSRFSVGERLAHSKHLVVLGDPGAGKSTMLRWIATACLLRLKADPDWSQLPDVDTLPDADWLPLLIRCRDLDTSRIAGSLEEMIQHHLCDTEFSSEEAAELTPLLLRRMREGRVLLLIDGLDEISDPGLRAKFCRKVEKIHLAFPDAPVIVTSRIVGYREMKLRITRGFEHVTVQELTPQDKDDFARRWCVVTESPARRESAAQELISDIHSTDRIERLTGSPMLLTTMALVKKKVGKLPSRRADLYREAVDVLLHWRSDVDERMDPHEALPQLQYLAYAMCASGDQQIRQDKVVETLERMRREFPAVRPVRQRSAVEFLRRLERQTGILVESGHVSHDGELIPVYEFRHLTFQEYLAGLALVARRYPDRNRQMSLAEQVGALTAETTPIETSSDRVETVIAENWREAIRLTVMTCNDDDVDGVLRAIATPLPGENAATTARARAALACACLADEPNVSEEVAADIITRFVAELTDLDGTGPAETVADLTLEEMGGSSWAGVLSRRIVTEWLRDPSQYHRLAGPAAMLLGRSAPTDEEALHDWVRNQVARLDESEPAAVVEAGLALMEIGYTGKLVLVPDLTSKLTSTLSGGPCEATAAAWALGWVKRSSAWEPTAGELADLADAVARRRLPPQAVVFLLWCFDDAQVPGHDDMARALMDAYVSADRGARTDIGEKYLALFPQTVEPVVQASRHQRADIRREASLLLARLDSSLAMDSLLGVLIDDDGTAHDDVVKALGTLGDPRAVEPLLALLTAPDGTTNHTVATSLGELGDRRAVQPLIDALPHTSEEVHTAVVEALGTLGDPRAVEPLLALLTAPDGTTNHTVATSLGELGDRRAVQPLIDALPHTKKAERAAVVAALGNLRDPRALEPLLGMLNPAGHNVDPLIAHALGLLGDSRAVQPLLDALPGDGGTPSTVVVEALGRLADRRAVDPLLSALRVAADAEPQAVDLLVHLVEALAGIGDPRALQPLSELQADDVPRLHFRALTARMELGDTETRKALDEAMTHSDVMTRRSALWALAALESDRVDQVLLSRDRDGDAPGIDPQQKITESALPSYANAVRLSIRQVRSRYEELAKRYPLTLAWLQPPST
ncbi:PBS lyase HEAT-like repeat-containing protein [Streptomyces sp. TLI_55]|uniref:HEAT repeat domain-containing protein n=1 Tax=Streptomyces sp. TLI_55 TaxID=1938861 RepID=UPI000BCA0612|nr:HEAT repeat domain-containing protein [Streptomyces sp. TLI_55]SNX56329.1 PBS lyase HEAT-like repeat-containing protein [Streptomyces sp. TLI_55]